MLPEYSTENTPRTVDMRLNANFVNFRLETHTSLALKGLPKFLRHPKSAKLVPFSGLPFVGTTAEKKLNSIFRSSFEPSTWPDPLGPRSRRTHHWAKRVARGLGFGQFRRVETKSPLSPLALRYGPQNGLWLGLGTANVPSCLIGRLAGGYGWGSRFGAEPHKRGAVIACSQ